VKNIQTIMRGLFPWKLTIYFMDGEVQESWHQTQEAANIHGDLTVADYGDAVAHFDTVNTRVR
jgi:hypothetical protein